MPQLCKKTKPNQEKNDCNKGKKGNESLFFSPSTSVQQKNEIKKMELGGAAKRISRSKRHSTKTPVKRVCRLPKPSIHRDQKRSRAHVVFIFLIFKTWPQGTYCSPPLPQSAAKAGRNHLNKENAAFLPTGIGERYSQTILITCLAGCPSAYVNSLYRRNAELTLRAWLVYVDVLVVCPANTE